MSAKVVLWFLGIVIVVLLGILIFYPGGEKIDPTLECSSDSDCVFVDSCCDCNNGGVRAVVNKDSADEVRGLIQSNCEDVVCAAVISDHPNCQEGVYAKCWDGICGSSIADPNLEYLN